MNKPDLLGILLDGDNHDPILLANKKGQRIKFEQIAVIPYEADTVKSLYCILKPIDTVPGVGEDEAIVFRVCHDSETGESTLHTERDGKVARAVFDRYHSMLAESRDPFGGA